MYVNILLLIHIDVQVLACLDGVSPNFRWSKCFCTNYKKYFTVHRARGVSLGIVGWTLGSDTGLRAEDFDLAKILDLSLQRGEFDTLRRSYVRKGNCEIKTSSPFIKKTTSVPCRGSQSMY